MGLKRCPIRCRITHNLTPSACRFGILFSIFAALSRSQKASFASALYWLGSGCAM